MWSVWRTVTAAADEYLSVVTLVRPADGRLSLVGHTHGLDHRYPVHERILAGFSQNGKLRRPILEPVLLADEGIGHAVVGDQQFGRVPTPVAGPTTCRIRSTAASGAC